MPLGYVIPSIKPQLHQGATSQDTIPTPIIDNPRNRIAAYNLQDSPRYRSWSPVQTLGVTSLDTTIPIPPIERQVAINRNYVPRPIVSPTFPQIHQGPSSLDLFIPRLFKNPISAPIVLLPAGNKFIDVPVIIPFQDTFKPRSFNPYPLPYKIPAATKFIQIPPYANDQTYIFPVQKPDQAHWQRQAFYRYIKKIAPWIDNTFLISSGDVLLACVDTSTTWETHFTSNGWASPQAQITAGYPIYIQPSKLVGSYQEVFDFGSIISNIIVIVNWNATDIIAGVTTASTTLETSVDNITYSAPAVGTSLFAASIRYVRLSMNFVGATDKALALYSNLQCLLNVHREQDGGSANVYAADVGGTTLTFNKAFKALDALAITPIATVQQKAVYDFAFPPNPTTFKVLLYDAAGARVDGFITWVARGIL